MTLEAYRSATDLSSKAMEAHQDEQTLELSLFVLSLIGDGDYGLASSLACDALDLVEARVTRALSPELAQENR